MESPYMTVGEAQMRLGVSKHKIADLIKRGILSAEENPLDRRQKLIKQEDVEALGKRYPVAA